MDITTIEKQFAVCLLRLDGEPKDAPLDRLNSLQVQPSVGDFKNIGAKRIVALAYKFAKQDRSITPRFAAAQLGIDEQNLLDAAAGADVEGFTLYAEQLLSGQRAAYLKRAAEEAVEQAQSGQGKEALDTLSDQIAALQAAQESTQILDADEASKQFVSWYQQYQEEMKSGTTRWSFQFDTLNDMIPYVFPGHAVLVTAPSKIGKSSLCQQWFDHNTGRGLHGLFFHFEDSPEVMGIKRTARKMSSIRDENGNIIGLSQKQMLRNVLSAAEMDMVVAVNKNLQLQRNNGKFIHSAGWTMEQCMRVVWRYRDWVDFFMIDYIGKEFFGPAKLRNYGGPYGAAAYDAELVKTTADRLGKIAIVVQQEHESGGLYGTKQTWQKFQVWISLSREKDGDKLMGTYRRGMDNHGSPDGSITVKNANMGETGAVPAWFYPEFGLWAA